MQGVTEDGSRGRVGPTVSVVIPVKNDGDRLVKCLDLLNAQSRPANEIIVVDNGSTDDSAQVARDAGATVISCLEPGIPAASARGYDAAAGDIIFRLDADCEPAESWIENILARFEAQPDIAAFTGFARFIDGPVFLRTPLAALYLFTYEMVAVPALGHRPLFGSNFAMRKVAWESVQEHVHRADPELHDDLDLSFHIGLRHKIRYLRGEAMGMSMRPFFDLGSFCRRTYRGIRTILLHWPQECFPMRQIRPAAFKPNGVQRAKNVGESENVLYRRRSKSADELKKA